MSNIKDVNVLDPNGDSFLDHAGIGDAIINSTGQITQIDCGVFATTKPIPQAQKSYVLTGTYDDPNRPHESLQFKVTLQCTAPGRPKSTFT